MHGFAAWGFVLVCQASSSSPVPPAAGGSAETPPAGGVKVAELAQTRVSVYGRLHLDAYWGDARVNHQQFTMWANSHDPSFTPGINDRSNWIDWTPRMSILGVRAERDGLPRWEGAKVLGLVEFDFQNRATSETNGLESESRETPRLRHAYVKVADGGFSLLAGQASDLISPLLPSANYDAIMWNAGNLGDRRPQLRVSLEQPAWDGTWNAALALARTGAVNNANYDGGGSGDAVRDGDDSALPMVQGRVGIAGLLGGRLDAGLWGHAGWESLEVPLVGEDEFISRSVGLDVKVKLLDGLVFSGEVWTGSNLSDVRGGIGQGVNTTLGREIRASGGWAELSWAVVPSLLTLAAGATLDDPRNRDLSVASARSRNVAPFSVAKVDLGGGFTFGVEWIQFRTRYLDLDDGRANRFTWFVGFAF